jgi:hypothetical protein
VKQLYDETGKILPPDILFKRYDIINNRNNLLFYYGIHSCIPKKWKSTISTQKSRLDLKRLDLNIMIKCKGIFLELKHVNNNSIYWTYIEKRCPDRPRCDHYWSDRYNIPKNKLKNYYYLPYVHCRETKIQALQVKIIHGVFPCGRQLFYWKKRDSPLCPDCAVLDNTLHYLIECPKSYFIWDKLNLWWSKICDQCTLVEDNVDILLGIPGKGCHIHQRNKIIFWTKWYVYSNKHMGNNISLYNALRTIKMKLDIEEFILRKNDKYLLYHELWSEIHQSL